MGAFKRRDLQILMENSEYPCVTIYMPTHHSPTERQKDQILLKNLLGEAESQLSFTGLRTSEILKLLEPIRSRLEEGSIFGREASDGLALFVSPDFFRFYRLPIRFDPLAIVGNYHHLKPLIPLLSGDGHFFVLLVSKSSARLIQGTRFSANEVEVGDLPSGLAGALRYDDREKQLQFHTGTPSGVRGKRPAVFHGHGAGADDHKEDVVRYFRQIDKELNEYLKKERAPLVFAGVDYLFPIYREVNTYPHLMEEALVGNYDNVKPGDVRAQAWDIVSPLFRKDRESALQRYAEHAALPDSNTLGDLKKIVRAASQGRIETLVVASGVQQWGNFDEKSGSVYLHKDPDSGGEDLLNWASVLTLLKGGTVYTVDPNRVPSGKEVVAICRF
jgi:hypothetical protein